MIKHSKTQHAMRSILGGLLACLMLTACGGDMSDLQQYIAEVKARPATPIEPIPPVKTYQPYPYDGTSGRDPFRSSSSEGRELAQGEDGRPESLGPRPDFSRDKEYLENFELDTLSMVGTFANSDGFWGLIRDPDGRVHRVIPGEYLGKNHGQITLIDDGQVVLSELINDGTGGWLQREAALALEG